MPELTNDYVEGYTKAKEEDEEKINKAYNSLHTYEHECETLKKDLNDKTAFIENNCKYIELGKALVTILNYLKEEQNE